MKSDIATIIAQLEQSRRQQGIDQEELAKRTGWSVRTIRRMIKNPEIVKYAQVEALAEALGVPIRVEVGV